MSKNISIKEFIKKFDRFEFSDPDVSVQIDAGWYDWFCKDSTLVNKTKTLGKKVKQLAESDKIDTEKSYVFFKNNCPMNGPLYDSFSICDLENGDVQFWVTPRSGHSGEAEVFAAPNFDTPAAKGKWKDIKNYFGV